MSRSHRPRLKELRGAYRLVRECVDLGADVDAWRLLMLEGLRALVGARVGLYLQLEQLGSAAERLAAPLDAGFLEPAHRALWQHYQEHGAQRTDPFHLAYYDGWRSALRTRSLEGVVDRRSWSECMHYHEYLRPCGLEDRITTSLRLGPGPDAPVQVVVLHRDAGDGRFPRRLVRLVHLFHHELGSLLGRRLRMPGSPDPLDMLPPRLREVLACLLEGDTEKQVARRLGISPYTVNRHVQRLYRHFEVRSRAQLAHRCTQLEAWPRAAAWAQEEHP